MSQPSFIDQLMKERKALSVSELTSRIKKLIEGRFVDVWVEGEISNFRSHSSGHWYFTLKDEGASVRCASFRMQNRLIRFAPEDGLTVRARGRVALYEARGEYQLLIEHMEPVGAGALQIALEQLKQRLLAEGMFEAARKRELPLLPRCVGVVTSPTGAAIHDILRILRRRNRAIGVLLAPAKVQGHGAALEIEWAIEALNSRPDVDVIIVGRGGGSSEDLWAFNEEGVARAIFNSRAPVVSAVGHEIDFTLADLVADLRAPTPSAAAEMVAIARDHAFERLTALARHICAAERGQINQLRRSLASLQSSRAFDRVPMRLRITAQRVDSALSAMEAGFSRSMRARRTAHQSLKARLGEADVRRLMMEWRGKLAVLTAKIQAAGRLASDRGRKKLSLAAGKLDTLSPLGVLGRGYAIAFDNKGRVIRRAGDVATGDRVKVRVSEGEIDCVKE
jgi:exodeoxyribonuclease VII large subunit